MSWSQKKKDILAVYVAIAWKRRRDLLTNKHNTRPEQQEMGWLQCSSFTCTPVRRGVGGIIWHGTEQMLATSVSESSRSPPLTMAKRPLPRGAHREPVCPLVPSPSLVGSVLPVSATAADWLGLGWTVEQGRGGGSPSFLFAHPPCRETAGRRERAYNAHWVATSCFNHLSGGHQLSGRCIGGKTCLVSLFSTRD